MALPVTIPNTFANATASIPLSQLDTNFNTLANAVNGISDGSETLANVTATVANITTLNASNVQVTNIKANDGTAAGSIADSTGVVTLASSVLTTTDINGGTIDDTAIGSSTPAAGSFTTLNTSGAVVFNDAGADVDFRVEGDTNANLIFADASADFVGIGTNGPNNLLTVQADATGAFFGDNGVAQIIARGATDSTKRLGLGIDTTNNVGVIQATQVGVDTYPLALNPAGGNVGIGTSSPSHKLEVSSTGDLPAVFNSTQATAYFQLNNSTGGAGLFTTGNAVGLYTSGSGTERMRITSGGALWAGNTTRQNTDNHTFIASVTTGDWTTNFQNNAASGAPLGILINYSAIAPNGTGSMFIRAQDSSVVRFDLRSNGGIANYQANDANLSDRREKTNFAPAKNYLETICAIPIQTFNYIDQNLEEDDGLTLGVVAQDVQEVAPELVMESNWGTEDNPKMRLSIYQTDLQYALMKCIQELKAELDTVKAELATLKG